MRTRTRERSKPRRAKLRPVSSATTRLKLRGPPGAAWKVRVAEPPEDGRANEAVLRLLADTLDVPRSSVSLVSGHASRDKIIALAGVEQAQAEHLQLSVVKRG